MQRWATWKARKPEPGKPIDLRAGNLAYRVHSSFFPMTRHEFDLIHYCGMLITKVALFILFLCPYLGIRLVLKRRGGSFASRCLRQVQAAPVVSVTTAQTAAVKNARSSCSMINGGIR